MAPESGSAHPPSAGRGAHSRSPSREFQPARVLVCDQDHAAFTRMLTPVTGPVVGCEHIEEALRLSTSQAFDVVFIGVPQHSGTFLGLLQLLRRALPRTPIILVLEDPSPAARLATLAVRPFYVLVPPVPFDELDAVLANALTASRRAS